MFFEERFPTQTVQRLLHLQRDGLRGRGVLALRRAARCIKNLQAHRANPEPGGVVDEGTLETRKKIKSVRICPVKATTN